MRRLTHSNATYASSVCLCGGASVLQHLGVCNQLPCNIKMSTEQKTNKWLVCRVIRNHANGPAALRCLYKVLICPYKEEEEEEGGMVLVLVYAFLMKGMGG